MKTFPAHLDHLRSMIHWIREQLIAFGLNETMLHKAELACEEALVNVIQHAYKQKDGVVEIEVDKNRVIISDYGPLFNPLEQEVGFDPAAPLEERKIGGLGIYFIRQYTKEVHYSRVGNKNVLTLTLDSSRSK